MGSMGEISGETYMPLFCMNVGPVYKFAAPKRLIGEFLTRKNLI